MKEITMHPIGIIHSPYIQPKDIPIQGRFKDDVEAWLELDKKYVSGLKDLNGFSHAILLFYFHQSNKVSLSAKPYLENEEHGIFAIRSPHRPNHIGLSIVKILKIHDSKLYFNEVDMIDNTPLLDIKPYVNYFDNREQVSSGWIEKHFQHGTIPKGTIHTEDSIS